MTAKSTAHEPSAHIPMILRLSASTAGDLVDTHCETPVTLVDLMPTILTAAGTAAPQGLEGLDLAAIARGNAPARRCALIHGSKGACHGITDGRWKYICFPHGAVEHLFDLVNDPMEIHNLSGQPEYAAEQERLRQDLLRLGRERRLKEISEDGFVGRPPLDTAVDRSGDWHCPGFHSEYFHTDVRH